MNKLNDTAKSYDMKINVKKTKTMIITKNKEEGEAQETEGGLVKSPCAVRKVWVWDQFSVPSVKSGCIRSAVD